MSQARNHDNFKVNTIKYKQPSSPELSIVDSTKDANDIGIDMLHNMEIWERNRLKWDKYVESQLTGQIIEGTRPRLFCSIL